MELIKGGVYTVQQIVQNSSLPVLVKKESWSNDFQFRIERIEGQKVCGTAFKNGNEHHRKFGPDYSYTLSDPFVFLGVPYDEAKKREEERLKAELERKKQQERFEHEQELIGVQKESEQELSKVAISDIFRVNGALTEKQFQTATSNGQLTIMDEEQKELARILEIIRNLIAKKRESKTVPEKPSWFDAETGPRGILDSEAMRDYLAAGERNAAIDQSIGDLQKSEKKPYFYHIRLSFSDADDVEDIFVGERLVYDKWPHVVSWRSKLGGLAYEKDKLQIKLANNIVASVQLRREVIIENSRLTRAVETYNRAKSRGSKEEQLVYDQFLVELLEKKRSQRELTNIIPSIQRNQYQIIKAPANENLIVQGCAGSGKTMILLHRISYLLYNEKRYRPQDYLVLSPSVQFNQFIHSLVVDLGLTRIDVKTVPEYYIDYLLSVSSGWRELSGDARLQTNTAQPESYVNYLYSEEYMKALQERVPARVAAIRNNEAEIQNLAARRKELKNSNQDASSLTSEIERLKRQRRISIFDAEFIDLIPPTIKPGNRKIPVCKAELYATALLNYFCYGTNKQYQLIFIDEGQDLAACEYELLRSINKRAIMDVYGDIDQRINDYSIASWDALKTVGSFSRYTINENYRNTVQIGSFVNDELMKSMTVLGLDGPEVVQVPAKQVEVVRRAFPRDRKAIIYKDARLLSELNVNTSGYELLTVNEAKGMEFETVFVIMNGLNDNEWYVACTRALNKLYLIDAVEAKKEINTNKKSKGAGSGNDDNRLLSDDSITISEMVRRLSKHTVASPGVKISFTDIVNWLVSEGDMDVFNDDGIEVRVPTEKGNSRGIMIGRKRDQSGKEYKGLFLEPEAQRYIKDNLKKILGR